MVITIKLKLYPPNKEKDKLLHQNALLQSECINFFIEKMREKRQGLKDLHNSYYREARKRYPISADMICSSEMVCIRMTRRRKIISPLKSRMLFMKGMILKIQGNNLGLTFGKGRIWIPFHSQQIPEGKILESKLKHIDGAWYCFLSVEVKEQKIKKYKKVLGVDLGIAKIATLATANGKNTRFFRGEPLRAKRTHYYELRKRLQPKIKQGNVYKLLKRISKKESNWMRNENHRISREIIRIAKRLKSHIALENLKGITERLSFSKKTRRMMGTWTFRQLTNFISYKAHLEGLEMFSVDPRATSKGCPKCGYVARNNRRTQSRFKCRKCGYESNADRIGAMNIAIRATSLLA